MKTHPLAGALRFGILLIVTLWCGTVLAINVHWDGGGLSPGWNNVLNWSTNTYPGTLDAVSIGNIPSPIGYGTVFVPELVGQQYDQIGSLTLVNALGPPPQVRTNGFELIVNGATTLSGGGAVLFVEPLASGGMDGDSLDTDTLTINPGAAVFLTGGVLEVDGGTGTNPTLQNGNLMQGWGTIDVSNAAGAVSPIVFTNGLAGINGILATGTPSSYPAGNVYTLTINLMDPASRIDLDGPSGDSEVGLSADTNLVINGQLYDDFSGTLGMSSNARLIMSEAWSIDNSAVVNVNAESSSGAIPGRARIEGGAFTARSGSTINLDTGRLEVVASSFTVNSGATIDLDDSTTLQFDAPTTISDPASIVNDATLVTFHINRDVTIGSGSGGFDWDGKGPQSTTWINGATLRLNVDDIDSVHHDGQSGTINLVGGNLVANVTGGWLMNGSLNLDTTPSSTAILGTTLTLDSQYGSGLHVWGGRSASISAPFIATANAKVLVDSGTTLTFSGASASIGGGAWTGQGTVILDADVTTITAPTTITMPQGTFDLDGVGLGSDRLLINNPLILNVAAVDESGNDLGDDIDIHATGRLDVRLTDPTASYAIGKSFANVLNLNAFATPFSSVQLAGSDVELAGTVRRCTEINCRIGIDLEPTKF